nr:retrovirus-related Pol polyprotein from transposon TNT 1-94 [Tanacetum cinerariifolium]
VMIRDNALIELGKKIKKAEQERDKLKLKLENFQTSSKNLSQLLASQTFDKTGLGYDNQVINSTVFDCDEMFNSEFDVSMPTSPVYDRYKSEKGYHAIPPPYTGTFMPPKPDLVFHDAPTVNETIPNTFNVEPKDKSEGEPMSIQKASSFVPPTEHVKTPRPSVKPVEHPILAKTLRKDILKSRGHGHSKNRKIQVSYGLGSQNPPTFLFDVKGNPHHALKDKGVIDSGCSRVLVTQPHNKTPYEIFLGRTPSVGFMRHFGCPVTIINTLDPLGKFDGKADEGFLVGYFPESEVHVSPRSSAKTKKHDDKTKREAKGKNMPALEDITYSDDEEDVGAKANFSNLETTVN